MAWRARLDFYVHVASTDVVEIVTAYEELDGEGQVLVSLAKTWGFMSAEAPDAEAFALMMLQDLEKTVRLRQNFADYEAMKATPVEISDPPGPLFPASVGYVSQTDAAIMAMKAAMKPVLVDYLKANTTCTYEDTLVFLEATLGAQYRSLTEAISPIYIQGAHQAGLIPEATFEAFRDWIVATPRETVLAI